MKLISRYNRFSMKGITTQLFVIITGVLLFTTTVVAQDSNWTAVSGEEKLRQFMSGLTAERKLPNGELSRGEYLADGTGTLYSWGGSISRTWTIKGDDQLCITAKRVTQCYALEHNSTDPELYRVRDVTTGKHTEFRITNKRGVAIAEPKDTVKEGSAATPSADEIAAELSNPNTSVASLTFKNQFRTFEGNLPGTDDQTSYTLTFQPSLPFTLASGDKVIWRPAISLLIEQPVQNPGSGTFESENGLGDIGFDLVYAPKTEGGLLLAYGFITSLPTATNDLGTDKWTLGPEILIGKLAQNYLIGIFPNHQWDIAGSGKRDINLTTIQAFYTYLPGGGWSAGTAPIMTYDWEGEQWTIPLQINAGKTVVIGGRPWKFSAELNYYVEKADAFGAEWMLGINIAPVVKNGMASWFSL